jgi:hypothetical protein
VFQQLIAAANYAIPPVISSSSSALKKIGKFFQNPAPDY